MGKAASGFPRILNVPRTGTYSGNLNYLVLFLLLLLFIYSQIMGQTRYPFKIGDKQNTSMKQSFSMLPITSSREGVLAAMIFMTSNGFR